MHVAEITVMFVVGQQHVFHLLEVDVRADFREGRVRIGVGDILALEQGDMTIGAVNILFYIANPKKWVESALLPFGEPSIMNSRRTYSALLFFPPFTLFCRAGTVNHALPPSSL